MRRVKPAREADLQLDVENIANNVYVIGQEGEFLVGADFNPAPPVVQAKLQF